MNLNILKRALERSWSKKTAYPKLPWTVQNPAAGQCAVTALIVNDYLGGEIVWCAVELPSGEKVSHYFNVIAGREVDLTRSQFSKEVSVPKGSPKTKDFSNTREFMLSNQNTLKRYELLKLKVEKVLNSIEQQVNNVRYAARTVVWDDVRRKIAVIEVQNGLYHKIPGGGVDDGETLEETAIREAKEECGCKIELLCKLGESEFKSTEHDFDWRINHSTCFLAKKIQVYESTAFTEQELGNNFKLMWLGFDEAINKFENVKSENDFELNMNNRDLEFVKKAKAYCAGAGLQPGL